MVGLVDEMRAAGELHGARGYRHVTSAQSAPVKLKDLGLPKERLKEWRKLRDALDRDRTGGEDAGS